MSTYQKIISFILSLLILAFVGLSVYAYYVVLKPLESDFDAGTEEIKALIKGQEDRTELLEQITLYRDGLYGLGLLLEARENVISGSDEENPFLVFNYNTVLEDLRRLLPKDATAIKFQVNDKGLMTIPVESVDYASLGRVLRSFKDAQLFTDVQIPSAVQRAPKTTIDAFGNRDIHYVYSFVVQATLDPNFWKDPLKFTDIKNSDYFVQAIRDLNISNSVEGYSDNTFRPTQAINRAEFYKLTLHASYASGLLTLEEYSEAIDAPESLWYDRYVELARKKDILFTNGEDDPYHLDKAISRIEALQTVMKIFEVQIEEYTDEVEKENEEANKKPAIVPFQDVGVKSEFYPLVHTAYKLGMLHEDSFYRFFEPAKPVSRSEVAYWVWKLQFDHLN